MSEKRPNQLPKRSRDHRLLFGIESSLLPLPLFITIDSDETNTAFTTTESRPRTIRAGGLSTQREPTPTTNTIEPIASSTLHHTPPPDFFDPNESIYQNNSNVFSKELDHKHDELYNIKQFSKDLAQLYIIYAGVIDGYGDRFKYVDRIYTGPQFLIAANRNKDIEKKVVNTFFQGLAD